MSMLSYASQSNTKLSDDKPYYFSIPGNFLADRVVESILKLPYEHFVEGRLTNKQLLIKNSQGSTPDVTISITTASCYKIPLAHVFTHAINKRFNLCGKRNTDIMTCLHEATNNAILHGNLQVKSDFRTIRELYEHQDLIQQRLADETYRKRRINIAAWNNPDLLEIAVSDEGSGFELGEHIINSQFPSGRGLMFIYKLADKVELAADNRTLFMSFHH